MFVMSQNKCLLNPDYNKDIYYLNIGYQLKVTSHPARKPLKKKQNVVAFAKQ